MAHNEICLDCDLEFVNGQARPKTVCLPCRKKLAVTTVPCEDCPIVCNPYGAGLVLVEYCYMCQDKQRDAVVASCPCPLYCSSCTKESQCMDCKAGTVNVWTCKTCIALRTFTEGLNQTDAILRTCIDHHGALPHVDAIECCPFCALSTRGEGSWTNKCEFHDAYSSDNASASRLSGLMPFRQGRPDGTQFDVLMLGASSCIEPLKAVLDTDWALNLSVHYGDPDYVHFMNSHREDWEHRLAGVLFAMVREQRFRCTVKSLLPKDQDLYLMMCSAILMDKGVQDLVRMCYRDFLAEYCESYMDELRDFSTLAQILSHVIENGPSVYSVVEELHSGEMTKSV